MDWHDSFDAAAGSLVHQLSGGKVDEAAFLEIFAEFLRIHVVGEFIDVHKIRPSAGLGNRFRRSDESIRDGNDSVSCLHASSDQGKAEGICSVSHADAKSSLAKRCKILFERF